MGLTIKSFNAYNFFLPDSLLLKWDIKDTTEDLSNYMYIIQKGDFYGDNIFFSSPNNIGSDYKNTFEQLNRYIDEAVNRLRKGS